MAGRPPSSELEAGTSLGKRMPHRATAAERTQILRKPNHSQLRVWLTQLSEGTGFLPESEEHRSATACHKNSTFLLGYEALRYVRQNLRRVNRVVSL